MGLSLTRERKYGAGFKPTLSRTDIILSLLIGYAGLYEVLSSAVDRANVNDELEATFVNTSDSSE